MKVFDKYGKKRILKNVMLNAHELFKAGGLTFSEALKKAWAFVKAEVHKRISKCVPIEYIMYKLHTSVVEFGYIKLDGTYRLFKGTLNRNLIPNGNKELPHSYNRHAKNLRFFDLTVNEWRSLASGTKYVFI